MALVVWLQEDTDDPRSREFESRYQILDAIFLNIWEHESSPGMDLDLMFTSPKSADSL